MMRAALIGMLALSAFAGRAQDGAKPEKWRIDPYTKNEPAALKKAGYVSYAPIEFGEHAGKPVSSDAIDETLGDPKILWVETAHFKLGSALPPFVIPATDRELKLKLRAELTRLKEKIPRVNPTVRRLDSWLRLHLFAQRLEDLYAEFCKRLDVTMEAFPQEKNQLVNGKFWGMGPYLGQPAKYTVLILRRESDYTRYLSLFVGRTQAFAQRWNYKTIGSQLIATAEELEARLKEDTGMHCHIVFNVAHNLINGYRFYAYDLPVWYMEGMAHWFSRNVSEKYALDFDQNESARADMLNDGNWRPKVRTWLAANKLRPTSELLQLRDFGMLTKYDHVKCWSLIDYLMTSGGDKKWRAYMNEIKGFIDPVTKKAVARDVLELQRNGLRNAYDLNPLTLEEKWKEWVIQTYPTK